MKRKSDFPMIDIGNMANAQTSKHKYSNHRYTFGFENTLETTGVRSSVRLNELKTEQ